jgi:hypothetical protein
MFPLRRNAGIHVKERCLDEELVGIARQRDDFFDIQIMTSDVDHVGDFLPARCVQGMLPENIQRQG